MTALRFLAGSIGVLLAAGCGQPSPLGLGEAPAPTWARDIAPIIHTNCLPCHSPGEVAPFPLLTHEQVRRRAEQVADVTHRRLMPPWKLEQRADGFIGGRQLTDREIRLIREWARNGAPEGDPAEAPPTPAPVAEGWALGEPDLVLELLRPYPIPAEGLDLYRYFVLPTNLTEDKWVKAVEIRPSNRRVTHHAVLFVDSTGRARRAFYKDPVAAQQDLYASGWTPTGGLGGWLPGQVDRPLPDGVALPLRAGSDLILQLHLTPNGRPELERTRVGLYFTDTPPERPMLALSLSAPKIDIPPGEDEYVVTDSFRIPVDIELHSLEPHAHLIARRMDVWIRRPGDGRERLLTLPDWDMKWQEVYRFRDPLILPAGTIMEMRFEYDNSVRNIRNPFRPPQRIQWGLQTKDEMAMLIGAAVPVRAADARALADAVAAHMSRRAPTAFEGFGAELSDSATPTSTQPTPAR